MIGLPASVRPGSMPNCAPGELDLDALSAFAKSAGGTKDLRCRRKPRLRLDIDKATFAGVDAQAVNAQVKFNAGKLQIDRLSVGDLAGAKLDISGRIDELSSQPRGQMTFDLNASALDGVSDMAAKLMPQEADSLRRVAARLAPAKVHAVLSVAQSAATPAAPPNFRSTAIWRRCALSSTARRAANRRISAPPPCTSTAASMPMTARRWWRCSASIVCWRSINCPASSRFRPTGPVNGDIHVDGKVATSGLDSTIAGSIALDRRSRALRASCNCRRQRAICGRCTRR